MAALRMILIADPELIPALRERVGGSDEDVLTFADSEPLLALEAISAERPKIIALERLFAASPRGAALISRIKSDESLDAIEIRILAHDSDYSRVSPRGPRRRRVSAAPPRLDTGTRRVPRFRMREGVTMMIENRPTTVVDLSELGAQVAGRSLLKPKQQVHALLDPGGAELELQGVVVWARVENVRGRQTHRAGIEFPLPDRAALAKFCAENRAGS